MRDDVTYIVTQKVTATENENKLFSRERILLDLRNSRSTSFRCELLRCLECTVSWCTRSVHAANGRVHGTGCKPYVWGRHHVRVMNGPCTWPVRSLYTAVDGLIHRPQTRAYTRYTAAYMGRKHGRVDRQYTAVYGPCTVHGP